MNETLLPQTEDEETTGTGRRMDAELRAMGALLRILEDMEEPTKTRVVNWLAARHAAESWQAKQPPK